MRNHLSPAEPKPELIERSALARLIDEGPWTARQKRSAALAGLAVLMDGFDSLILALAVPAIARDWGVAPASFVTALSASLAGMMAGNAFGGAVGDRVGRRLTLATSVLLFGITTGAIAFIDGTAALTGLRLAAGIGLGAAMPNASALVGELTPKRRRTFMVTLTTLCNPIGTVVVGLAAGAILPVAGWRVLFLAGGVIAIIIGAASALLLDESPFFLARSGKRRGLEVFLKRLGADTAPGTGAVSSDKEESQSGAFRIVLAGPWRRDTIFLWVASVSNMLGLYAVLSWLPSLLVASGYSLAQASFATSGFNAGGVAGALAGAVWVDRFGSRKTLSRLSFGAAFLGSVLAVPSLGAGLPFAAILTLVSLLGFAAGAVNILLYPLALSLYPPPARAGGLGLNLSIGRIGAVAAPFLAVAASRIGGGHAYFAGYAFILAVAGFSFLQIHSHIPGQRPTPPGAARS